MRVLANRALRLAKEVHRYRRELSVAAQQGDSTVQPPSDWGVESRIPDDAISDLVMLLHWANRVARSWEPPNLTGLMKSKSLLFLLGYVWSKSRNSTRAKGYRLSQDVATKLALIVHSYDPPITGRGFSGADLSDKLTDFAERQPLLARRLLKLVRLLDLTARS
jgi:hypothetical protein